MMRDASIPPVALSSDGAQEQDDGFYQRLKIMRELRASLSASHESLVKSDLEGIDRGTREQLSLSRMLAENLSAENNAEINREGGCIAGLAPADATDLRRTELRKIELRKIELKKIELRKIESEVLQALRLQSALLVRARRKLRILANMLAGPSGNYSAVDSSPSPSLEFVAGRPSRSLRSSSNSTPATRDSSQRS